MGCHCLPARWAGFPARRHAGLGTPPRRGGGWARGVRHGSARPPSRSALTRHGLGTPMRRPAVGSARRHALWTPSGEIHGGGIYVDVRVWVREAALAREIEEAKRREVQEWRWSTG
eukprot:gene1263-biopygen2628